MLFYDQMDFGDGPVMMMPPGKLPLAPSGGCPSYHNKSMSRTSAHSSTSVSINPSSKRSRDAMEEASASAPHAEEIYGEGMMLLNPSNGMSIAADSQTGTWVEERAVSAAKEVAIAPERPKLPGSRKSMRLDGSGPAPLQLQAGRIPAVPDSPPKSSSTAHPTIDDFTHALGIGWTRLASEDADVEAAVRGWARYLDNHYSRYIHGAEILLQSKGLNAYLVRCCEGFFLFNEHLLQGRLVGRSWATCLENLRTYPTAFEGDEVLRAESTPGPDAGFAMAFPSDHPTADAPAASVGAGTYTDMDLDWVVAG